MAAKLPDPVLEKKSNGLPPQLSNIQSAGTKTEIVKSAKSNLSGRRASDEKPPQHQIVRQATLATLSTTSKTSNEVPANKNSSGSEGIRERSHSMISASSSSDPSIPIDLIKTKATAELTLMLTKMVENPKDDAAFLAFDKAFAEFKANRMKKLERRASIGVSLIDFEHCLPGGAVTHSDSHKELQQFLEENFIVNLSKSRSTWHIKKGGSLKNYNIMNSLFDVSKSPLINALKLKKAYRQIIQILNDQKDKINILGEEGDKKISPSKHGTTKKIADTINGLIGWANDQSLSNIYSQVILTLEKFIEDGVNPIIEGLYDENEQKLFSVSGGKRSIDGKKAEEIPDFNRDASIQRDIDSFGSPEELSTIGKALAGGLGDNTTPIQAGKEQEIRRPIVKGGLKIFSIGTPKSRKDLDETSVKTIRLPMKKSFPKNNNTKLKDSSSTIRLFYCSELTTIIDEFSNKIGFDKSDKAIQCLRDLIAGSISSARNFNLKAFFDNLGFTHHFNLTEQQINGIEKILKDKHSDFDSFRRKVNQQISLTADSPLEKLLIILCETDTKKKDEAKKNPTEKIDEKVFSAFVEYFRKGFALNNQLDVESLISFLAEKECIPKQFKISPDLIVKAMETFVKEEGNFDNWKKCKDFESNKNLSFIFFNLSEFAKEDKRKDSEVTQAFKQFESMCQVLHLVESDKNNARSKDLVKILNLIKFIRQDVAFAHNGHLNFLWKNLTGEDKQLLIPAKRNARGEEREKQVNHFEYHFNEKTVTMRASGVFYLPTLAEKELTAKLPTEELKKALQELDAKKGKMTDRIYLKTRYTTSSDIAELHDAKSWNEKFSVDIYIKGNLPKKEMVRLDKLEVMLLALGIDYRIKRSTKYDAKV